MPLATSQVIRPGWLRRLLLCGVELSSEPVDDAVELPDLIDMSRAGSGFDGFAASCPFRVSGDSWRIRTRRRRQDGSWATASGVTSIWSAAALDPAFPWRSAMASGSPDPAAPWSAKTVSGWNPNVPCGHGLVLL